MYYTLHWEFSALRLYSYFEATFRFHEFLLLFGFAQATLNIWARAAVQLERTAKTSYFTVGVAVCGAFALLSTAIVRYFKIYNYCLGNILLLYCSNPPSKITAVVIICTVHV